MVSSTDEIEIPFFRYLAGELPLKEFEQWIYSTPEVESYWGQDAYLELISFSYQQRRADHELSEIIYKYIDPVRFHSWQIKKLLQSLLDNSQDPVIVFEDLYYLFLEGYQFLGNVGFQYVLGIDDIPKTTEKHLWNAGEYLRRRKLLDNYLQPLKDEMTTLLQGLESGDIELTKKGEYFVKPELAQKLKSMRQQSKQEGTKQPIQPKKK